MPVRLNKVNLNKHINMSVSASLRDKLYDYIRVADEKKLYAIYQLLENEITVISNWWEDKKFMAELDKRYTNLLSGADKGITTDQIKEVISKRRLKKYGR